MNKKIIIYIIPILLMLVAYFFLKSKIDSLDINITLKRNYNQIVNHDYRRVFIYFDKVEDNLNEYKEWILYPLIIAPIFFLFNFIIRKYNIILIYFVLLISIIGWYIFHYFAINSLETDFSVINDIYNNKKYLTSKGFIKVLHKQPSSGHDEGDIILINHNKFIINYYYISNHGYNTTISNGGILTDKKYVYAKYINDVNNSNNVNNIIEISIPKK